MPFPTMQHAPVVLPRKCMLVSWVEVSVFTSHSLLSRQRLSNSVFTRARQLPIVTEMIPAAERCCSVCVSPPYRLKCEQGWVVLESDRGCLTCARRGRALAKNVGIAIVKFARESETRKRTNAELFQKRRKISH